VTACGAFLALAGYLAGVFLVGSILKLSEVDE